MDHPPRILDDLEVSEEEFETKYQPIPCPEDGGFYWNNDKHPDLIQAAKEYRLWTAVDGDDGATALLSGWHLVNRFAYVVTAVPFDPNYTHFCQLEGPEYDDNTCHSCGGATDGPTLCSECAGWALNKDDA